MINASLFSALSKSKFFLFSCLSFIFGIGIASFLPQSMLDNELAWFTVSAVMLVIAILFWDNKIIGLASLVGLFLFLSVWRYSASIIKDSPDKIWHYNGQKAKIIGIVNDEPAEKEGGTQLKVQSEKVSARGGSASGGKSESYPIVKYKEISGNILVTVGLYPKYEYGDELELDCKLEKPDNKNFPYDRYLARFDIYSVCYLPAIRRIASGQGNIFYTGIFKFKNIVRNRFDEALPDPESGLARGFILGDLKAIDDGLSQDFSRTGLSHIVAISGENISIVAGIVMSICLWAGLGRRPSFYFSNIFLIIYIILVGAPASAIRAGLMGFLVLWALYLGRLNKTGNSLVFAAAILLYINPRLLRDDIGFQLSFLALLGLVYVYPAINSWFDKISIPRRFGIRDVIAMSIAAQILSIPIIIYNFSQFSAISLLANILVLWTLPSLMMILPVSIFASFVIRHLDFIIFLIPQLILKYVIFVARTLVKIPYAYLEIDFYGWIWIAAVFYYAFWIWLILRNRKLSYKKFPI